jgi:hypothetical protein
MKKFTGLVVAAAVVVAAAAACNGGRPKVLRRPWLFLVNGVPNSAVSTYSATIVGPNNVPEMVQQPVGGALTTGAPSAMQVVDSSLYVATGSGVLAQFAISPLTGALTAGPTTAIGSPPFALTASRTALYATNLGSANVSVLSIGAAGSLTALQTASLPGVKVVQLDTAARRLFAGTSANGGTAARVCTFALQADGSLPAAPASCATLNGDPDAMAFANGVLFIKTFGPMMPAGNTNYVSAWTVDPASGAATLRGTALDIGAANAGNLALSADGKFLFVPRQGGFLTLGTGDPLGIAATPTPITNSQNCMWPPATAGMALADPRGGAVFITDPIGFVTGNLIGGRLSALSVDAGGKLTPYLCDNVGMRPIAVALYLP